MKRFLPVLSLVLSITMLSCQHSRSKFDIYPLSPYTDTVKITRDDVGSNVHTIIKTQFYIVNESTDYTEETRNRLQNFIETQLGADIKANKSIYFTFYKGSFGFGKNSSQTKSELLANHANDKLAEFEYIDGKFYNFDFYKDGTYYTAPTEAGERDRR